MAGTDFDREQYLAAKLTPVFFGAAINNFGVRELLNGFTEWAPPPQFRHARLAAGERDVQPQEEKFTGFVFKIQANMDPQHRDRSEEHTSELQSLMRISYAVFCLKKNNNTQQHNHT